MRSPKLDISFLAAGIVANSLSDENSSVPYESNDLKSIFNELVSLYEQNFVIYQNYSN
jgi:hypothetical protein